MLSCNSEILQYQQICNWTDLRGSSSPPWIWRAAKSSSFSWIKSVFPRDTAKSSGIRRLLISSNLVFTSLLRWTDWHLISAPTWRSSILASIISVAGSTTSWNASYFITFFSQYQRSWLTWVLKHPWNPLISLAKYPLLIDTGAQTDAIPWKMLSY